MILDLTSLENLSGIDQDHYVSYTFMDSAYLDILCRINWHNKSIEMVHACFLLFRSISS